MSTSLQEIVCCMGQPVAGNPTQFMMERAFEDLGLDWRYLTLEVSPQRLGDAIRGMRAMGFRGANFTIPHKVAVIEHLDGLSQAAELMGAVNCVVRDGDRLLGENTDGKGFVEALRTVADPAGKKVVILGAGGAARAIAVELGLAGIAELTVVNRSLPRGQGLVDLMNQRLKIPTALLPWQGDFQVSESADILVQATSIGLSDESAKVPLATSSLRPALVVADVIFNPPDTRLIREARAAGCLVLDGLGMLVNQAMIGFALWTGVEPRRNIMQDALEEYLGF